MKDYKHIEHMRNLNDSLIWERMKRCYDYGYEDGQKEKPQAIYEMKAEEYNKGLNDAWECARKISMPENEGGMSVKALQSIFGKAREIFNCTASEAIAKIKEYEDKQKCKECKKTKDPIFYGHCVGECDYAKQTEDEIKVGDEIRNHDAIEVVTSVMSTGLQTIDASGNTSTWYYNTYPLETWKKTGRHFDEIKIVLDKMGEVDG